HVHKHANKHKCPTCCKSRGSPGWNDKIHSTNNIVNYDISTPQDCCNSCVEDPNCVEWLFHNRDKPDKPFCTHGFNSSDPNSETCSGELFTPSSFLTPSGLKNDEGGIIRCSDG
ncbi:33776_t:CDS:1, partial [Racocetra persica]